MHEGRIRIDSGVNAVLGVWLFLAPIVLGYGFVSDAVWNGIFVGTILLIAALVEAVGVWRNPTLAWISFVAGAWLVVAPFVLDYAAAPLLRWNGIIVGVLVMILAWRSATATTPD